MTPSRWSGAVAGAVSAGVALALGEVLAALVEGVPSPVEAVASMVIPLVPPGVKDWAIAVFGTSDKSALAAGTVVVSLLTGALAGVLGLQRRENAAALFVVFGGLGLLAALSRPLVAPVPTALVAVVVPLAGWMLLRTALQLRDAADGRLPVGDAPLIGDPRTPAVARRAFLGLVGGAGTLALGTAATTRSLTRGATVDVAAVDLPTPSRQLPSAAPGAAFEVDGLTPILVPNDRFYRIDTVLSPPRLRVEDWILRIHGMVDREVVVDWEALTSRPQVERDVTLACVSNEVGGNLVGNARWQGVRLTDLLDEAGVQDGATQVVPRSVDGWTGGFPTEAAFDGRDPLVAIGMNGAPLPPAHGFPARLVVPGLYGYVSATKWLTEVELTTLEDFDAYWVPRGWAKRGPIKTQSRIDVPRDGSGVAPGEFVVAGVAWAPQVGIDRVEVRVDEGAWRECELSEPLSVDAWVQWRTSVPVEPGAHVVEVRATDASGTTQSRAPVPPRPDGAEGWHRIRFTA